MKIFLSFLFVLTIPLCYSQDLRNTQWIKIFTEKRDRGQITNQERAGLLESYYFKDTTVLTSINHQFSTEMNYKIENGILTFGNFIQFSIDTVNEVLLELTEIPHESIPDSEINTYAFIKSKYLFEYLKENNQIQFLGDTLIQCTEKFAPEYSKGDLALLLRAPFKYREDSVSFSGFFIIDPNNKINFIHLNPSASLNIKEANAFEKALKRTGKSWILPVTDKPYYFKMDFHCFFKTKFQREERHGSFPTFGGEFYSASIKFYSQ